MPVIAFAGTQAHRGMRITHGPPTELTATVQPGSPIATGAHPRIFLTSSMVTDLRTRIKTDTPFRTRYQTGITQLESATSNWTAKPNDELAATFAAFLTMLRRPGGTPDDDLFLTWGATWQEYRDTAVSRASNWVHGATTKHERSAMATALMYDFLYSDMSSGERAQFETWIEQGYAAHKWLANSVEVYDNGASGEHSAKLFCALVSADATARFPEAYSQTLAIAETNDWMGFGFGLGREWHDGSTSRHGVPPMLYALQYSAGLNDALTINFFLTHLRDTVWASADAMIPHPSAQTANKVQALSEVFHTQDVYANFATKINAAAHLAWAIHVLPGKVDLDGTGLTDQATLANSEANFIGFLRHLLTRPKPVTGATMDTIFDVTKLGYSGRDDDVGRFWAFPPWFIYGIDITGGVTAADAGLPNARHWWPETLGWTWVHSPDWSYTSGTVVRYTHRRYACSNYERGCDQNGRWTVHRDGPLLLQRAVSGHHPTSRLMTWCANGAVTFIDPDAYPLWTWNAGDEHDQGEVRDFPPDLETKSLILAQPLADFGHSTRHIDAKVATVTSYLTRSYNSTETQYGVLSQNPIRISKFERDFVTIRRGADGTTREKVFTYDRIQLVDTKYEPRYHLSPTGFPNIDGTESEVLPWGPDESDPNQIWFATGPTMWTYDGATRLICENATEPPVTPAGNGKACVTWLDPSGAGAVVRRSGGLNAVSKGTASWTGSPFFSEYRGWKGEKWDEVDDTTRRAFAGMNTVTISPADVAAWNTAGGTFLIACEVMAAADTPSVAEKLTCDAGSVAARAGASAVVFSKAGTARTSGSVTVPAGVTLVILHKLAQGATRTLSVTGAHSITSPERDASDDAEGVLNVVLSGEGGELEFS